MTGDMDLCFLGSSVIMGPQTASGQEQGSLMVQCHYDQGWEKYVKYWCQGAVWSSCKILVQTTGSEREVRKDRVSIKDHQKSCMFTVTMKKLRRDDTDTYWCGIEKTGRDPGVKVKVTIISPGKRMWMLLFMVCWALLPEVPL